MKSYDNVIERLLKEYPSINTYDPKRVLCNNGRCNGSDGKLPYYFNGDHLNNYGASKVIDDMLGKNILSK